MGTIEWWSQGRWNCGLYYDRYFLPNSSIRIGGLEIPSSLPCGIFFSCQWDQPFRHSRRSFPLKQGRSETKIDCQSNFRIDLLTPWGTGGRNVEWIYEYHENQYNCVVRTLYPPLCTRTRVAHGRKLGRQSIETVISKTFPGSTKFIYIVTIHLRGEERRRHSHGVMSRMIIQWNNFV